jgi:hypothetical protein
MSKAASVPIGHVELQPGYEASTVGSLRPPAGLFAANYAH